LHRATSKKDDVAMRAIKRVREKQEIASKKINLRNI
jgi:hypothetical protein